MSRPIVVDASVVLAVIRLEYLDKAVLIGSVLSAVNLAEVAAKTKELGLPATQVKQALALLLRIEPFTEQQAQRSGELRPLTRAAGLSLGDRACLALAMELDADVYTADRAWAALSLPCRIHLIR